MTYQAHTRERAPRMLPEDRRAQLLEAALRVFARRGLGAARHAEVAEAAGVAVSTVFVYCETRPALVQAVQDEVRRYYSVVAHAVHDGSRDNPLALILKHARAFADSVDTHPDHARVWLNWSSTVRDDAWTAYRAMEDEILDILAATLERGQREGMINPGIHPEDGARLAVGAAHMIARMKLSDRSPEDVERFLQSIIQAFAASLGR